jgi:alpha-beta hydrolase superfamily lysophospholipase
VASASGSNDLRTMQNGQSRNISKAPAEDNVRPEGFPGLPEGWISESETFVAADGKTLLFGSFYFKKTGCQKRALFVLHGHGEHGARYLHFPHYLNDEFDAMYCLDLRGHGRSGGGRGDVADFDDFARDLVMGIERFRSKLSEGCELHLFGHSMGGHVALRTCFLNPNLPLASVILSAPFLAIAAKVPLHKKIAASVLSKLWPTLPIDTGLDAGMLSHEQAVVSAYLKDKLVHGKMSPRCYIDMLKKMADTVSRESIGRYRVLFMVPLADRIVKADVTVGFCEKLKTSNKRLKTFPDFYHEIANETGRTAVFEEIKSWLRENSA